MAQQIPYKIYLSEDEMPKQWYNLRADMTNKPAPLLNPGTLQPMTFEELRGVFCDELVQQELDDTTAYFDIPEEIREFYKMYRPSPLVRAYCLEKGSRTPAKIYYKFEGNNTSGSHKLNSAIAQAYYAKQQGLTRRHHGDRRRPVGHGALHGLLLLAIWTARSIWSRSPMSRSPSAVRSCGPMAHQVTPSPSETTEVGRKILRGVSRHQRQPGLRHLRGCGGGGHVQPGLPVCAGQRAVPGAAAPVRHRPGDEDGAGQVRHQAGYHHRLRRRRLQSGRPDRAVYGRKAPGRSGLPASSPWSPPPARASPGAVMPTTSATPA